MQAFRICGGAALAGLAALVCAAPAWADQARVDAITQRLARASLSLCEVIAADGTAQPCASQVAIVRSGRFHAWFKGQQISVASRLVEVSSDDELAFVIAHEMAHVILEHPKSSISNELEADYWGAKLASRSGFDARAARRVFARTQANRVLGFPLSLLSYPAGSRRMREIERALAEEAALLKN